METLHLHNEEVIEHFENCDPSESSPHSRQFGDNACELFEDWIAHLTCTKLTTTTTQPTHRHYYLGVTKT